MKIVFITRTKSEEDFTNAKLIRLIKEVYLSEIKDIYVLSNFEDSNKKIDSIPIRVIKDYDPISPISFNTVFERLKKENALFDAIFLCSKEILIKKYHINKMTNYLKNKNLLVVGYAFKIRQDEELNKELQWYYSKKRFIAYRIPWNTCALWKFDEFKKIEKFDEITIKNPFSPLQVCIDNVCHLTDHRGMEDGLAIAKAATKNPNLKYKLIKDGILPNWAINPKKIKEHRQKLARKDTVLRNFMAIRNYSEEDLLNAELK